MKKIFLFGVFVLCVLLMGCFDFHQENTIIGKWIAVQEIRPAQESTYKPEIDQYYKASIYEITDSLIIKHKNYSNDLTQAFEYRIDTLYSYAASGDTLYMKLYNTSYERILRFYFTEDKQLVLYHSSDSYNISEVHYDKFQEELPPESWVLAINNDEYEPDGDIAHATTLDINITQSHTLTENDSDYYHISAEVGKSYLIRGLAYFGMEMYLYDQQEKIISYDDANDVRIIGLGDETQTAILWTCELSGDYYAMIKVDSKFSWDDRIGYYQMLVEEVDTSEIEFTEG